MSTKTSAPILLAVMGTTASGKSAVAEAIGYRIGAILINADAFQIYRGMDVGTAKPVDRTNYELLDIRDPNEHFGVGEWVRLAREVLNHAWNEQRSTIVVGGTGLYIRALFEGYADMGIPAPPGVREHWVAKYETDGLAPLVQELLAREPKTQVDLKNYQRVIRALEKSDLPTPQPPQPLPPFRKEKLWVDRDAEIIEKRIEDRTREMVENQGWLEEVQELLQQGFTKDGPGFRAHGYRAMAEVIEGSRSKEDAIHATFIEVRQYAKRQRTWLRKEPSIRLISCNKDEELIERAYSAVGNS